jgi:hypothetical protein
LSWGIGEYLGGTAAGDEKIGGKTGGKSDIEEKNLEVTVADSLRLPAAAAARPPPPLAWRLQAHAAARSTVPYDALYPALLFSLPSAAARVRVPPCTVYVGPPLINSRRKIDSR